MSQLLDAPVEAPAPHGDFYVVLHTCCGRWTRGAVVPRAELGREDAVSRLLALGAVRAAHDGERHLRKVKLPDDVKDQSYEQRLAEKDRTIMLLQASVRDLQIQLTAAHPDAARVNEAAREATASLIRQKDQALEDLQLRVQQLQSGAANADALAQENHALRQKMALIESQLLAARNSESIQARLDAVAAAPAPGFGSEPPAPQPPPHKGKKAGEAR